MSEDEQIVIKYADLADLQWLLYEKMPCSVGRKIAQGLLRKDSTGQVWTTKHNSLHDGLDDDQLRFERLANLNHANV